MQSEPADPAPNRRECACCRSEAEPDPAACGRHWYCELCVGRGHDTDCEEGDCDRDDD